MRTIGTRRPNHMKNGSAAYSFNALRYDIAMSVKQRSSGHPVNRAFCNNSYSPAECPMCTEPAHQQSFVVLEARLLGD